MTRNVYLDTVPIARAVAAMKEVLARESGPPTETVESSQACGRVTARAVRARYSSPTFHAAAMDGIAVRAADTFAAREDRPVRLVKDREFAMVNTGNPLPAGFDAVVMIEKVVVPAGLDPDDPDAVEIETPAHPWQHVRRIGEDIVATELLLPSNHLITPFDVGALLSAGIWEIETIRLPSLHVIPTGDEVLDHAGRPDPSPGQVVESNSAMALALAGQWGFAAHAVPTVQDDPDALEAAVRSGLDSGARVVMVLAGSSAGSRDHTREVFERLGRVVVHGVAAMPGKPTILGLAENRALLVGCPGYPVSAAVCLEEIVSPLVHWMSGRPAPEWDTEDVVLTRDVASKAGMAEYLRLAVGRVGSGLVGTPLGRGAGCITTLTRAQAMAVLPPEVQGAAARETVKARLRVPRKNLDQTLVIVGSHDNTLDLLADHLMQGVDPIRLVSTHVGSMGGIRALQSGLALCAGAHLFDPATGDFNFPFLDRYAPDLDVTVHNLAVRHQGLMVAPGNPLNIEGVADLAREEVTFINRQRGAGTRILLDHHLERAGIDPAGIRGYDEEEYTHMGVAVNVATGAADCGLGIMAAAGALGLDFVPLARERYDLLIPTRYTDDPRLGAMLEVVRYPGFQQRVADLGGYETGLSGRVMEPGQGLD